MIEMEPGYAYRYTSKAGHVLSSESWEDVVISEDMARRAKYIGQSTIGGNRMAIFKLGRSLYAQLVQNVRKTKDGCLPCNLARSSSASSRKPSLFEVLQAQESFKKRLPKSTIKSSVASQYVQCFERVAPKIGQERAHRSCLSAALDEPPHYRAKRRSRRRDAAGLVVKQRGSRASVHPTTSAILSQMPPYKLSKCVGKKVMMGMNESMAILECDYEWDKLRKLGIKIRKEAPPIIVGGFKIEKGVGGKKSTVERNFAKSNGSDLAGAVMGAFRALLNAAATPTQAPTRAPKVARTPKKTGTAQVRKLRSKLWIKGAIKHKGKLRDLLGTPPGQTIPSWIKEEGCKDPRRTYARALKRIPSAAQAREFQRMACLARTLSKIRRKAKVRKVA